MLTKLYSEKQQLLSKKILKRRNVVDPVYCPVHISLTPSCSEVPYKNAASRSYLTGMTDFLRYKTRFLQYLKNMLLALDLLFFFKIP